MQRDLYFLEKALEVAKLSDDITTYASFIHGAVVVKHGKIMAMAFNRNRNIPGNVPLDKISIHAETAALKQVANARGSTLYVTRYSKKTGHWTISRPCARCWTLMEFKDVKRVVYSTEDGRFASERV